MNRIKPQLEVIKSDAVLYADIAQTRATQLRQVSPAFQRAAYVPCQRTDVCPFAAFHAYLCLHLLRVKPQQFYLFHMYRLGVELSPFFFTALYVGGTCMMSPLNCSSTSSNLSFVMWSVGNVSFTACSMS